MKKYFQEWLELIEKKGFLTQPSIASEEAKIEEEVSHKID